MLLRIAGQHQRYPDPRAFLRFIPWKELEFTILPIDIENLSEAIGRVLEDMRHNISGGRRWATWAPPREGIGCNHHLFPEEETLQYCMEKAWAFPGHYAGGRVVFGLTPVDDTELMPQWGSYWSTWVCPLQNWARLLFYVDSLLISLFPERLCHHVRRKTPRSGFYPGDHSRTHFSGTRPPDGSYDGVDVLPKHR